MENSSVLLHIHNIQKYYGSNNSNIVKALDDISFDVQKENFLELWVLPELEKHFTKLHFDY